MGIRDAFNAMFGAPVPPPVFPDVPEKPLTPARAKDVFDTLAGMEEIAFGYARDGCYARAHLMCRTLFGMGLPAKKAWAFETGNDCLEVTQEDGDKIEWWFHVAPVLPVKMQDGKQENMVFDPSLFDGPVTLEKWGESMKACADSLFVVPCGVSPPGHYGDYNLAMNTTLATDAHARKIMNDYLFRQEKPVGLQLHSDFEKMVAANAVKKGHVACMKPVA